MLFKVRYYNIIIRLRGFQISGRIFFFARAAVFTSKIWVDLAIFLKNRISILANEPNYFSHEF